MGCICNDVIVDRNCPQHGWKQEGAKAVAGRFPSVLDQVRAQRPDSPPIAVAPSALDVQVGGDHYRKMAIQPIEFIHANGIPFIEGCIIKYAARWRDKGGVKDLEKIKHYVDLLLDLERQAKGGAAMPDKA